MQSQSHGHTLDIVSCLQVQRQCDQLRREHAKAEKTSSKLFEALLASQQTVAKLNARCKALEGADRPASASCGECRRRAQKDREQSDTTSSQSSRISSEQIAMLRVQLEKERRKTAAQAKCIAKMEAMHQETDTRHELSKDRCAQLEACNGELQSQLHAARQEMKCLQDRLQEKQGRVPANARALQELAKVTRQRDQLLHERDRLKGEMKASGV
eukprot:scpid43526/ scgid34830/ 